MKNLTSSNYHRVQIFCWNFAHVSFLTMSTKGGLEIFFILFRSSVINKSKYPGFCKCVETSSFLLFGNNLRSKQNKRNPKHTFIDIGKKEMCIPRFWFFESERALSKFLYEILYYLLPNYKRISFHKRLFIWHFLLIFFPSK